MSLDSHVFLIGVRGTGKTTVARELVELLEVSWFDSDDEIARAAGKSIIEMFAAEGEAKFRDCEEVAIAILCTGRASVISLGGGAVLRRGTRERIANAGTIVWLTASPAVLAERLAADEKSAEQRPSLTGQGLLAEIEQVLAERTPIYQKCANLVVDTENKSPREVAEEICRLLRTYPNT